MEHLPNYSEYINRLSSFNEWPSSAPDFIKDLVEAGFVYSGIHDLVFCFCCGVTFSEWTNRDEPKQRHYKTNELCAYITQLINKENENFNPISNLEHVEDRFHWVDGLGVVPRDHGDSLPNIQNSEDKELLFNDKMANEEARFQSYAMCPVEKHWPPPEKLANAGFYYDSTTNLMFCFTCGVNVKVWDSYNQDPYAKHSALSKHCTFICKILNRKYKNEIDNTHIALLPSLNGYTNYDIDNITSTTQSLNLNNAHICDDDPPLNTQEQYDSLGLKPLHKNLWNSPKYPWQVPIKNDFKNEHTRLRTFFSYPSNSPVSALSLAEAGFYYLQKDDKVVCYRCNIGLQSFQPEDTAWGEHQRYSPNCPLVIEKLGHPNNFRQNHLDINRQFSNRDCLSDPLSYINNSDSCSANLAQSIGHRISSADAVLEHECYHGYDSVATSFSSLPATNQYAETKKICNRNSSFYEPKNIHSRENDDFYPTKQDICLVKQDIQPKDNRVNNINHEQKINQNLLEIKKKYITDDDLERILDMGYTEYSILNTIKFYTSYSRNGFKNLDQLAQAVICFNKQGDLEGTPFGRKLNVDLSDIGKEMIMSADSALILSEEQKNLCKICMDNDVEVTFLPCGHLIACISCAIGHKICPMCRLLIHDTVRTYLS